MRSTTTVVGHPEAKPVLGDGSELLWAGIAEVLVAIAVVAYVVWRWRKRRSA